MVLRKREKPEISVIMSVYTESAESINVAVKSIINQTFANFELIIVNDNPDSQDTQKILEAISKQDDRIRLISNDRNRGLGYALNEAIKASRSNLIARMDTEDSSIEKRFEKQLSYINSHADVDLLFTQWIDINESGETVIRKPRKVDFLNISKSFFTKSLLMHPTLFARKEVLLENPYQEMGRPEDFVLWLKLIRKGYVFDVIEEPLYRYRIDRMNIEQRCAKTKTYSQNLLPHLLRESHFYWRNIFFWMFFSRTIFEYLVSRNNSIFTFTHARAARLWKSLFGA